MPRSYPFDHFTASKPSAGGETPEASKHLYTEPEASPSGVEEAVHYGHRFAETQAKLQEHREHPLPHAGRPLPRSKITAAMGAGAPIGVVPLEAPLSDVPSWPGLWEEGRLSLKVLRNAAIEVRSAVRRLGQLPLRAARLSAGEFRRYVPGLEG